MKHGLVLLAALAVCSSARAANADYNAFLKQIATGCQPLIIGRFNVGQAILHGGIGPNADHYNAFISYTRRLYRGTLTEAAYRNSLTAFIGPGTSNNRSFDCIVSHLPSSSPRTQ